MSNEIVNILNLLAERFGTTIEHLWEVLIRQAIIQGIGWVFVFSIFIGITITWWKKAHMEVSSIFKLDSYKHGALIATGLIVCVIDIISLAILAEAISMLINPEYWALKQILELLQ